ncbi:BTAD domain-containing putative transcriptional regulator [Micromonospora sp. NPDC005686]|uniref:AfsR/SARP family transcriptional regulator n=1 Tax=unclassified Micromonospora TaxID=2617518 RepID=UPI0033A56605
MDRLIDVVWPDSPPVTARQQVQNCVGRINSWLIRHEHLHTVRRSGCNYVLEVEDESVDERVFRAEYRVAAEFARAGNLSTATARLRTALAMWRGEALEDIGSERLVGEATHLQEMRVRSLEQLAEWEFSQGRHGELIPELSLWTESYPYNEYMHGCLARALHRTGRTAEALQVLQRLRRRFGQELGLGPGPALLRLEDDLLRSDETTEQHPPAILPMLREIQSTLSNLSEVVQTLMMNTDDRQLVAPPPASTHARRDGPVVDCSTTGRSGNGQPSTVHSSASNGATTHVVQTAWGSGWPAEARERQR